MKDKYATEGAKIVGSYSPPFYKLNEFDYPGIAKMINESGTILCGYLYVLQRRFPCSAPAPILGQ